MSERTKKLIDLINQGKTANEISYEMGISNKMLFNYLTMLRNKGFDFDRKYYDTGDIIYVPKVGISSKTQDGINIITDVNSMSYIALVISDMHFGSGFELEGVMDKIYDFCVKMGIHNIIITGDILDGTFNKIPPRISDTCEQIKYFSKVYPFDEGIINFALLGNHDYSILKETSQDFSSFLDSYRHDIVSLGYGCGRLNIKDDFIGLKHTIKGVSSDFIDKSNLLLLGHKHNFKSTISGRTQNIYVPSLSGLCLYKDGYEGLPGALLLKIAFDNNIISTVYINQLIVLDKVYFANELVLSIPSSKKGDFNNMEDYSKVFKK